MIMSILVRLVSCQEIEAYVNTAFSHLCIIQAFALEEAGRKSKRRKHVLDISNIF